MMKALCVLLSLEMALAQNDKIPQFALFIAPDMYYPSKETFCIQTSEDFSGFSHISVDLKTSSETTHLYTVKPNNPSWHCESFQVPEPAEATEKVNIEVQGWETGGKKTQFSSKPLTVRRKNTGTFIQTDRPIYSKGDKVMFRIVTMDQDMEVRNDNYALVELLDPQKNRLAQWKDVSPNSGIVDLSYQMSPEPPLGTYTIKTGDTRSTFTVEEYVLPKFEATIICPPSLSILDEHVSVSVSGKYTYGEPVPGKVTLKICQKKTWNYWNYWLRSIEKEEGTDLCYNEIAKTDKSGKLQSVVSLSHFKVRDSNYARELKVEATLEEEGTELKFSAPTRKIDIKSEITKLSFKDSKSYYQPGAPYRGKLVLETYDGKPLSDQKVYLTTSLKGETWKETFITDSAGEVSFQLSTSQWGKHHVTLKATNDEKDEEYERRKISVRYGQSTLYLKDIHVETKNSVQIRPVKSSAPCHENVIVTIDYTIGEEENDSIEFFHMVVVQNKITLGGQKKVDRINADSLSGSLEFPLPIRDISPSGKLLVFTKSPSGGVAADTITVQVSPCLKHEVNLKFSEAEALPGSDVKLHLQANGGSMCALRVVDKSVIMMKPEGELTESKLQNLVQTQRTYIQSDGLDYSYCHDKTPTYFESDSDSESYPRWMYDSYPVKKKDIKNIIQEMGILILSNWKIVAPTTCKFHRLRPMSASVGMAPPTILRAPAPGEIHYERHSASFNNLSGMLYYDDSVSSKAMAPGAIMDVSSDVVFDSESVSTDSRDSSFGTRVYFPESWIWSLHKVHSSGSAEMPVTVPDTITEWSAQMFCTGPGGLGLSSPATLKAFQPFFVDLTLPHSVKRGEGFVLKATMFNYLSEPLKVVTNLLPSDQYVMKRNVPNEDTLCLSGGEKKTLSWGVTPTIIGQMNISVTTEAVKSQDLCGGKETVVPQKGNRDAVIKSLMVEPEGTLVEQTHNSMLVSAGNSVTEKVTLELPPSHVPGSQKAFINICGDIMGTAMNNLDSLLAMSSGCGEQNMVRYAPNVYISKYLKTSDQLNPVILQKGKEFLEKGQERQLSYKHPDGSYSAFGKSDKEGSTWLTAFVLKCFSQAKEFTYIDENHMTQSMNWLQKQQKPNGCFKTTGRLLQNGLKGGVDDEVSLTAYVTAAMLEFGRKPSDPVVEKSLQCIQNESLNRNPPYKLALKSYAYTLAKSTENRAAAMLKLEEKATKADGLMFWSQESKPDTDSYWSKPKSVDVEMTAYVLLSLASNGQASRKELGDMTGIVRWLSNQQNGNGGFSSTQDTVVALQAMAKFASLTSTNTGSMTVEVTTERGFRHQFQVDNNNRLLLQSAPLPDIPGEYTMTATGNGTVFMQVVQRHHTPPAVKEAAFALSAQSLCVKSDLLQITVEFWYIGKRLSSNMALVEIKMLSGFDPQRESIENLKKKPLVKRVETKDDLLSVYIEKVTSEPQTLEILAEQTVQVTGLKPALIKVFDYYMPEEEKTIDYLINCP